MDNERDKYLIDNFKKIISKEEWIGFSEILALGGINFTDDFLNRLENNELVALMEEAKINKGLDVRKYDNVYFYTCKGNSKKYLYLIVSPFEIYDDDYLFRAIEID